MLFFPPGRPCGCLGAIRLADGVHMLLLGVLGGASLALACELGGFPLFPFGGKKARGREGEKVPPVVNR